MAKMPSHEIATQAMVSVVDKHTHLIVEHRLTTSQQSEEVLLDACSRHVSDWDDHTPDDREAICADGYYETGNHFICIIHLDENGAYDE